MFVIAHLMPWGTSVLGKSNAAKRSLLLTGKKRHNTSEYLCYLSFQRALTHLSGFQNQTSHWCCQPQNAADLELLDSRKLKSSATVTGSLPFSDQVRFFFFKKRIYYSQFQSPKLSCRCDYEICLMGFSQCRVALRIVQIEENRKKDVNTCPTTTLQVPDA